MPKPPTNSTAIAEASLAPRSPLATKNWTLIFTTSNGMCHPLRVTFETHKATEYDARKYGNEYLSRHADWLVSVRDCYPTNLQENANTQP